MAVLKLYQPGGILMAYRGDKYLKAYKHYRDKIDDKVSSNSMRIKELEKTVEWLIGRIIEELNKE